MSASDDHRVWIRDARTRRLMGDPLTGHTGPVRAVALGRLGGRDVIVSGSDDRTVRVWNARMREPVCAPLTGHTGSVRAVAVGRIGNRDVVVSSGADSTVRIWDPREATAILIQDCFDTAHAALTSGLLVFAAGQALCAIAVAAQAGSGEVAAMTTDASTRTPGPRWWRRR